MIYFTVAISYLYHIILSPLSAVSWLDLGCSLSLGLIIGKGFGGFFTPKNNNFIETFKCHMDFAFGLV